MRARAIWRRCVFPALLAAGLGACVDGEVANPLDSETWTGRKIEDCLTVRPLAAASTYTEFREGGGRDLTDIAVQAEFVDVGALCGTTPGIGGVISRDGGLWRYCSGSAVWLNKNIRTDQFLLRSRRAMEKVMATNKGSSLVRV